MDLKERKRRLAMHPRVTFHEKTTRCTAFATARTSVSTYYHPDPEVRAAKQERARCRQPAHWRFRALAKSWAKSGDYCWSHIIYDGIHGDMAEDAATQRWYNRTFPEES